MNGYRGRLGGITVPLALLIFVGGAEAGCAIELENRLNRCVTGTRRAKGAAKLYQQRGKELSAALSAANKELARFRSHGSDLKKRLEALGQKVGPPRKLTAKQKARLFKQLRRTKRQIALYRLAQVKLEVLLQELIALRVKLLPLIKANRIDVRLSRGRWSVVVPAKALFRPGQARLLPAGLETLKLVATALGAITDRRFGVAVHTDNRKPRSFKLRSNWALSSAQAVAVLQQLVKSGLPAEKISAAGYASSDPVAENDKPAGRAKNSRVEILLLPRPDEVPNLKGSLGAASK